jgi:DNA topoisomerase-1
MRAPEDVRKYLEDDLFKLYQLIWQRFVASQMLPAVFDQTTIDIQRGRLHLPGHRVGAEIRRIPARVPDAGVQRRPRRRRKGRRGRGRNLPRVSEGQTLRWTAFVPTSTSPSRRRAITTRRW